MGGRGQAPEGDQPTTDYDGLRGFRLALWVNFDWFAAKETGQEYGFLVWDRSIRFWSGAVFCVMNLSLIPLGENSPVSSPLLHLMFASRALEFQKKTRKTNPLPKRDN